jgi:hypothetical protein
VSRGTYPDLMPHPDRDGIHTYLTHTQARLMLCRYTSEEHACQMLAHPNLVSAPMAGRPGERAYREADIVGLCQILAGEDPGGEE